MLITSKPMLLLQKQFFIEKILYHNIKKIYSDFMLNFSTHISLLTTRNYLNTSWNASNDAPIYICVKIC